MTPTLSVDLSGWRATFERKLAVTRKPMQQELYYEGRLLALELINSTPPRNKAQGEKAVSNDLKRLFSQADQGFLDMVGAEHGTQNIDAWYDRKARPGKTHLLWQRLDPSGSGMREFHLRSLNRFGRVSGARHHRFREVAGNLEWSAQYAVSKEDREAYRLRRIAKVGSMRAGWLRAFNLCQSKSPGGETPKNWITRHSGNQARLGDVHDATGTAIGEKFLELINYAPGITNQLRRMPGGSMRSIAQWALRKRVVAMKRNIKHMVTGESVHAGI